MDDYMTEGCLTHTLSGCVRGAGGSLQPLVSRRRRHCAPMQEVLRSSASAVVHQRARPCETSQAVDGDTEERTRVCEVAKRSYERQTISNAHPTCGNSEQLMDRRFTPAA